MSVVAINTHPRFKRETRNLISRRQLEHEIGYGKTMVFRFIGEDMPVAETTSTGHRFDLAECRAWLEEKGYARAGTLGRGYANTPEGATNA